MEAPRLPSAVANPKPVITPGTSVPAAVAPHPHDKEFLGRSPKSRTAVELLCYAAGSWLMEKMGVTDRHKQFVGSIGIGSALVKTLDVIARPAVIAGEIAKHGAARVFGKVLLDIGTEPVRYGFTPVMSGSLSVTKLLELILPNAARDAWKSWVHGSVRDVVTLDHAVGLGTIGGLMWADRKYGYVVERMVDGKLTKVWDGSVARFMKNTGTGRVLSKFGATLFAADLFDMASWGVNRATYGENADAAGDFQSLVTDAYFRSRFSLFRSIGVATDTLAVMVAGDMPLLSWLGDCFESGRLSAESLRAEVHTLRKMIAGAQVDAIHRNLVWDAVHEALGASSVGHWPKHADTVPAYQQTFRPTADALGRAMADGWLDDDRRPSYAREYSHAHEGWYDTNVWQLQKYRLEDTRVADFVELFTDAMRTAGKNDVQEGARIVRDAAMPAVWCAEVRSAKKVAVYRELLTQQVAGKSLQPPRSAAWDASWDAVGGRSRPDLLTQARAHGLTDAQGRIVQSPEYFTALMQLGVEAEGNPALAGQLRTWGKARAAVAAQPAAAPTERQRAFADAAVIAPMIFPQTGDAAADVVHRQLSVARADGVALSADAVAQLTVMANTLRAVAVSTLADMVQVRQAQATPGASIDAALQRDLETAQALLQWSGALARADAALDFGAMNTAQAQLQQLPAVDSLLIDVARQQRALDQIATLVTGQPPADALAVASFDVTKERWARTIQSAQAAWSRQPIGDPDPGIGARKYRDAQHKTATIIAEQLLAPMREQWGTPLRAAWADAVAQGTLTTHAADRATHAQTFAALAKQFNWMPSPDQQGVMAGYAKAYLAADGANTGLPQFAWTLNRDGQVADTTPMLRALWKQTWNRPDQMRPFAKALVDKLITLRAERAHLTPKSDAWIANNTQALNIRRMLQTIKTTVGANLVPDIPVPLAPAAQPIALAQ